MTIEDDKAQLRMRVGRAVAALTAGERDGLDAAVCDAIVGSREYRGCEQLIAYKALKDEVSVAAVIAAALATAKAVFLPVVAGGTTLDFRRWQDGAPLLQSAAGVLEPAGGRAPARLPSVVLVPGRAFDAAGNRLGRGGGHYDRALDGLAGLGTTVGVAYSCQLLDAVPVGPRDRRVSMLVSEEGLKRAGL